MNVKGYSLSDLGRSTDIGAKFGRTFSFGRASDGGGNPPDGNGSATALQNPRPKAGGVQVSLGIFGRNGGVFSQPTALKTLEDNGYDITALGDLGLDAVNPAPTGLSIKAGNSVNALIEAEFDLDFAHVRIQGMPELSASEDAVHQLITTLQSSWELGRRLQLTGTLDIGFQTFEGTLEREIANLWGAFARLLGLWDGNRTFRRMQTSFGFRPIFSYYHFYLFSRIRNSLLSFLPVSANKKSLLDKNGHPQHTRNPHRLAIRASYHDE